MKLQSLYEKNNIQVLKEYLGVLKNLGDNCLTESKITITIDDKEELKVNGIPKEARDNFVEQAKSLGNFGDVDWINKLVNGMKQVGIQGFNEIVEDERPVTNKDIQRLIGILIELVSEGN